MQRAAEVKKNRSHHRDLLPRNGYWPRQGLEATLSCGVKNGIGSLTFRRATFFGVDLTAALAGGHVALAFDPTDRVVQPG